MKIGIVGTIWLNTPPPHYGGTEEVIANLADGLAAQGHQVTLFAPATSHTKATLAPTVSVPLRDKNISWGDISYNLYHMTQAFGRAKDFDILHVHLNKNQDYVSLPLAITSLTPVLTTLHFALPHKEWHPERYQLLEKYKELPFTSISTAQREDSDLNFIETVHNSLRLQDYPFVSTPNDYFLWLGKIIPHKGTKEAILAAKKAGVKLIVAGVVDQGVPESVAYFEEEVEPLIDGKQITFIGEVGLPYKAELLGKAKALLNPISWVEPFGLVMVEAQATGTPVIAFNRGAASEVILDGKTGFLVNTVDEMVEKIRKVDSLKRTHCRAFVKTHFSIQRMVEGYEMAYEATIEHWETYLLKQKERLEAYKGKVAEV